MVVVSHLFFFLRKYFRGRCDSGESHRPLSGTIYFPTAPVSRELLKEHLTIYFKYVDQDYHDLKRILGMDPLEVTILRCGTFKGYKDKTGKKLRHINPSIHDVQDLVKMQELFDRQRRY